jgi:hypothetical protein
MSFVVIGAITEVETFAIGTSIRELPRLRKIYGRGRWRKRKGRATVRLPDGTTALLSYTGTRRPESVARNSRSSGTWTEL